MKTLLLLTLVSFSFVCLPTGVDSSDRIVLERAERPGWWQATYVLDQPAKQLVFKRQANGYRDGIWQVITPGWSFRTDERHQLLRADAETASARVVVEFPVHTEQLPKEYELFKAFTDGSLALYTGHFYASPQACPDEFECPSMISTVEIHPARGERLVVRGQVHDQGTTWRDPVGDGTYLYFGAIEPLETDTMIAIVDPGAPAWLVEELHRRLPEFFTLYSEGFGEVLPGKPVVLFSFEDVELQGLSSGGGTLTGLIQMSAKGSNWKEANADSAEHLLYLIAHEAAHMWNGQLHGYVDGDDSWMHEGSADAFAELLLLKSGSINAERLAERRSEALNQCVAALSHGSLLTAGDRGSFDAYYSCGNLIAVWSMMATGGELHDLAALFRVWTAVFAHSDQQTGRYDRETYFAALDELDVPTPLLTLLTTLLDTRLDEPAARIKTFLRAGGIDVLVLERPAPSTRKTRAAQALQHLMAEACGGRNSFDQDWPALKTRAMDGCPAFSSPREIIAIAGYTLVSDGDLALAALLDGCAGVEPVELQLADNEVLPIECRKAPAEPAPALAFPMGTGTEKEPESA